MISDNSLNQVRQEFIGHVTSNDAPVIHATCGIPGAGKSYFVDVNIANGTFPTDAYILNPDRVMIALPEYKNHPDHQKAYEALELPVREIAYGFANDVLETRGNIVKDMGCANPLSLELIKKAKGLGYQIHMYYIQCSIDEAYHRISQRDFQISHDEVANRLEQLEILLPEYQSIADKFIVFDNTDLANPFQRNAA